MWWGSYLDQCFSWRKMDLQGVVTQSVFKSLMRNCVVTQSTVRNVPTGDQPHNRYRYSNLMKISTDWNGYRLIVHNFLITGTKSTKVHSFMRLNVRRNSIAIHQKLYKYMIMMKASLLLPVEKNSPYKTNWGRLEMLIKSAQCDNLFNAIDSFQLWPRYLP
jgi:hypothetical protein